LATSLRRSRLRIAERDVPSDDERRLDQRDRVIQHQILDPKGQTERRGPGDAQHDHRNRTMVSRLFRNNDVST
jgi:hypothetical protein